MNDNAIREKTVLFIDGSNFYAAARTLGMDIDYARMRAYFAQNAHLIRAYYYTALPGGSGIFAAKTADRLA